MEIIELVRGIFSMYVSDFSMHPFIVTLGLLVGLADILIIIRIFKMPLGLLVILEKISKGDYILWRGYLLAWGLFMFVIFLTTFDRK
ncbi:MAG: hypothetical protein HY268_08875 [Deltaproteobacteria bacterium]|nr:hypothetical protein [Deltaproteobacteria bacterium]